MTVRYSVVVATFHRPGILPGCLEALTELRYPKDAYEVIVVDDGSPAPLDAVVAPYADRMQVTLERQENMGPAEARNRGARVARGEYLAFTDDDCAPDAEWLRGFDEAFGKDPEVLAGGSVSNGLPGNPYTSASHRILEMVKLHYNRDPERALFFPTMNLAMRRERFWELGGLASPFRLAAEDRDFCHRWIQHGRRIVYVPAAHAVHRHDLTLTGFWEQHFRYGRGAWRFHESRREHRDGRLRDHLPFHSELPRLFRESGGRREEIPALILWQLANTAGYLYEGIRRPRP